MRAIFVSLRLLFAFGILMPAVIGCTTPTTLRPTAEILRTAEQSYIRAEASESVRYATDDFLTAKSELGLAQSAIRESQATNNQELKESKRKTARRSAYEVWLRAEIATAKAKEEKAKEQIKQLRFEIAQFQADRQRFEAEEIAAKEKRAKEIAESAKGKAQQEALDAQKRASVEKAAREAAQRQALQEQQAKEQALRAKEQALLAKEQALSAKSELEARLVAAMQEIAKVREEKRGLIVSLSDILFEFGKSSLAKGTQENLGRLGKILKAYPDRQIVVEGHTDNIGGDEFNQMLSLSRAQAVRDALIEAGVNQNIIKAAGFGKAQPIANNDTPEGRQQNRRVEVVVLNPPAQPSAPASVSPMPVAPTTEPSEP